eukprot:UN00728
MVMEKGPEMFDCYGASYFYTIETEIHYGQKLYKDTEKMLEIPVRNEGLTSWVLRNGEMINTPDAYQDERFDSSVP